MVYSSAQDWLSALEQLLAEDTDRNQQNDQNSTAFQSSGNSSVLTPDDYCTAQDFILPSPFSAFNNTTSLAVLDMLSSDEPVADANGSQSSQTTVVDSGLDDAFLNSFSFPSTSDDGLAGEASDSGHGACSQALDLCLFSGGYSSDCLRAACQIIQPYYTKGSRCDHAGCYSDCSTNGKLPTLFPKREAISTELRLHLFQLLALSFNLHNLLQLSSFILASTTIR